MTTFCRYAIAWLGMGTALAVWGAEEPSVQTESEIDASISRGLEWIARGQRRTARSEAAGWRKTRRASGRFAGWLFGARACAGTEPYGPVVERIITRLAEVQRADGYLGGNDGKMYSHCIATLFLSEVSGMVRPELQSKIDQSAAARFEDHPRCTEDRER